MVANRSRRGTASASGLAIVAGLVVGLLSGSGAEAAEGSGSSHAAPSNSQNAAPKVVVPFDFVSKWDNGRYGEMVVDSIWKKLERQKGFLIPDTMQDVRDLCKTNNVHITPDTPLDKVREVVRKDFDAQIGIWGSVERAPGTEGEIYDIVLKCVDFSGDTPVVIYEKSARTNSVSEIPHLYVKEMLDKMYNRTPGGPPPLDASADERWKNNPNLVTGDFQQGTRGVPKGWEPRGGQQREPLGNLVKWIPETGNPSNRVIRFTIPKAVAEAEGVMYYSNPFPVEQGAKYRFQCRWRSNGPSPKVFIKCYDDIATDYRRESGAAERFGSDGNEGSMNSRSDQQRREVYRSQQNLKGPNNTWNTQTEDFTPKHTKFDPKHGRVMLYAYLAEGVVEWDDIVVKQIEPSPSANANKDRRHSLGTKVTIKEMEENERNSKQLRDETRKARGPATKPPPDEEQ